MRILLVSQYFWPESFIVNSLATELHAKGHQVTVLTGLPNYPSGKYFSGYSFWKGPWREDFQNVRVLRVPLLARGQGFLRLALNYLSFVVSGTIFSLFHKLNKPEVIFCFAPSPVTGCLPAIFIRFMTKSPLVFWVQDLWPESVSAVGATRSSLALKLIGKLVHFIYTRCDLILVQSQVFKESVIKWGGRADRLEYIPNWADPFIETGEFPAWVKDLPTGFNVGFAGNIGKAQDMPTLLAAAELLKNYPDIHWLIAGDGSEKQWLDEQIVTRNLQKSVITVGRKAYDEMLPFFKSCDAMLVSLVNEYIFSLTVPAKVQAYMSAGRPIIAAIQGEGAKIVNEAQAGLTCQPQKPEELANCILKLRGLSLEKRIALGENAKKYFEQNFARDRVIQQIEGLLRLSVKGLS